jgi:ABC-type Fe3+-hydroxamate transport system substrate-binding protein
MRASSYLAATLVLLLAGCAGSSTSAETAESAAPVQPGSTATEGTDSTDSTDTPPPPDGEDAASALSGFACSPAVGASQRWTAAGTLTNDGDEAAAYRTTVVVVDSTGSPGIASQRLVDLGPGESADVDLGRVRGPLDGTCQVQVLRVG